MKDGLTIAMFATPGREEMLRKTLDSLNYSGAETVGSVNESGADWVKVCRFENNEFPRGTMINETVLAADSAYICLTVPDTIWTKGCLGAIKKRATELDDKPGVVGAIRLERHADGVQMYFPSMQIPVLNCMLFRRIEFDKVGGFNPSFDGWGFYESDFCQRVYKSGIPLENFEILRECYWHEPHPSNENNEQQMRNVAISKASYFNGKDWVKR